MMRKKRYGRAAAAFSIALVVVLVGLAGVVLAKRSKPAPQAALWLQEAAAGLDEINIQAVLDPEGRSMEVIQTLMLTSRTEESRQELVLRTWANAFLRPDTSPIAGNEACCPDGFSAGSLVLEEAQVEQQGIKAAVPHFYRDDARTVMALPLSAGWQQGETLTVTLRYTVHFPHARYRFGWWENNFMAGHAFIVPALWQDGAYRTDSWLPLGDPLSGECANYTLTITVPDGYCCAAGGSTTLVSRSGGSATYRIDAPAVRDAGLVMSAALESVTRSVDGVLLQAFAPGKAQARELLGYAQGALEAYSERFGGYPWPVYTVCALPLGITGAEYTALGMVAQQDATLEYTVAHELAHQWWYALVGSDSQTHPWLDEALCEYSLLEYVEHRYGQNAREELRQRRIEPSMRITAAGEATPGAPLEYFETETDYAILVYGRAAAFLCAADELLSGGLAQVLESYAQQYALRIADRDALSRTILDKGGVDIAPLMVDYLDTYLIN